MSNRLPIPGSDDGTWGTLLNDFLEQSHDANGNLQPAAITAAGGLTQTSADSRYVASSTAGQANGVAPLDGTGKVPAANLPTTSNAVSSVNGQTGVVSLAAADVGLSNVDNTSDTSKNSAATTLTNKTISGTNNTISGISESSVTNLTTDLAAKYVKPGGGIPSTDLSVGVQTSLATADARNALSLQGTNVDPSAPNNGQVLVYSNTSSSWVPNTVTSTTVTDATGSTKGIVQLGGDLNGTSTSASAPRVSGLQSIALSATAPTTGQVLTATSTSAAGWATPAAGGVTSVAGKTGTVTLVEADVASLTTDLAAKAPLASPTFTGTVTVPTPTVGTAAATKSYVDSAAPNATTGAPGQVQLAGDLAGTATSPSVAKVNGIAVTGTPSNGQVLTATSGTAASWATPATGGGGSGYVFNIVSKTANYTASNNDFVLITSVSSLITITLPTPVASGLVRVKRMAAAGNGVQVQAPGSAYIDSSSVGTDTVNSQYQSQDYLSDGTNWFRV